jgi:hypothetical protein
MNYTVKALTDNLPDRGFTGHEYLPLLPRDCIAWVERIR